MFNKGQILTAKRMVTSWSKESCEKVERSERFEVISCGKKIMTLKDASCEFKGHKWYMKDFKTEDGSLKIYNYFDIKVAK